MEFREVEIAHSELPLHPRAEALIREGLERGRKLDCFDFVPSRYELVWQVLAALPRGRFCEWGSGMGVVTALAELLGFEARGIEIDPALADASRHLLADFGLEARIVTGDYLELREEADVYFVYCWPSQRGRVEQHFLASTPARALLLYCEGAEDVRRLEKDAG